eukprot:4512019-Prymnesium_polylepis.1
MSPQCSRGSPPVLVQTGACPARTGCMWRCRCLVRRCQAGTPGRHLQCYCRGWGWPCQEGRPGTMRCLGYQWMGCTCPPGTVCTSDARWRRPRQHSSRQMGRRRRRRLPQPR